MREQRSSGAECRCEAGLVIPSSRARVPVPSVGLLASARRKPEFTSAPSSQPDAAGVERVVRALGIGERIVVTDVGGKEVRGSIQAIVKADSPWFLAGNPLLSTMPFRRSGL